MGSCASKDASLNDGSSHYASRTKGTHLNHNLSSDNNQNQTHPNLSNSNNINLNNTTGSTSVDSNEKNYSNNSIDNNGNPQHRQQNTYPNSNISENSIPNNTNINGYNKAQVPSLNELNPKNRPEAKVLLLGSGESGKSTVIKQMKIIHQGGYSAKELYDYKPFVYKNLLDCAKAIATAYKSFDYKLDDLDDLDTNDVHNTKVTSDKIVINNTDNIDITNINSINGIDDTNNANNIDIANNTNTNTNNNSNSNSNSNNNNNNNDNNQASVHSIDNHELLSPTTPLSLVNPSVSLSLTIQDLDFILNSNTPTQPNEPFDPILAFKIFKLWKNSQTDQLINDHRNEFYLMDSAKYFFESLSRISSPDYIPTSTDVLRTRKKTSGIFETKFQMGNLNIHMYDVGGQRSERKKWIHCFDNVSLIIFCVALSEYDQVLLEEDSQNRLEESLNLFDSVVNSRWFARTSIVLFLNKIDVFAEKLPQSPLENYFPDYAGGPDINKAVKYIYWRFCQVNRSELEIRPHITQATDTNNIKVVFAAVRETILENSLKDTGLLY
ncbi:guanine nucleotide-binding protein subunit alpha [Ascoidea rubescens DSM 1968]|uniref:Guanine nucleotide binding protein, alpha subunit n=1 Tax=Ascoidea rubescens DSM 1968 TaxID=1344418 RepID=A0A1D2VQE7_9ASCO|nr:guanine nucleotide binding protein, alpha subunit [Ascoidea rubescens DSM 1968]ODV63830.1 guanine nucleotide binding protein, alpha subunit [Ascoidea rubescens DSM 1968]